MDLIDRIGIAVMRWQEATEAFDAAVADKLDLGSSELRCLSALVRARLSATALAAELHLSAGAATALVDRLERKGLVERVRDSGDRRKVFVRPTRKTRQMAGAVYGPIAADGRMLLATFDQMEQAAILRFVDGATALQQRHMASLADGPSPGRDGSD